MKFGDYTWQEIEDFIKNSAIVILPLGCTEQQGPHLTVDWDNRFITELCLQASDKAQAEYGVLSLVLPTIPIGPTPEHLHWPGFLNIAQNTHEQLVWEVLESLEKQEFGKIIVWSGCGGHDLEKLIGKFNKKHQGIQVYYPQLDLYGIVLQVGGKKMVEGGGHADASSTSWCLYLAPDLVRKEKIKNANAKPVDWIKPVKDFSVYTQDGALGDITQANSDFGRKSWELVVKEAAKIIREINDEQLR